jgi:hypothetical protein
MDRSWSNKLDEFLGNAQVSRFNPERYQKILQPRRESLSADAVRQGTQIWSLGNSYSLSAGPKNSFGAGSIHQTTKDFGNVVPTGESSNFLNEDLNSILSQIA